MLYISLSSLPANIGFVKRISNSHVQIFLFLYVLTAPQQIPTRDLAHFHGDIARDAVTCETRTNSYAFFTMSHIGVKHEIYLYMTDTQALPFTLVA